MSAPPSPAKRYSQQYQNQNQQQQHHQQQQQGRPSSHTPPLHSPTKGVMNQLPVFTPGMPVCRTHFSSSAAAVATPGEYTSPRSTTAQAPAPTGRGSTARPVSMMAGQRPSEPSRSLFSGRGQSGGSVGHLASKSLEVNSPDGLPHGSLGGKTRIDMDFEAMMDALEVPLAVRTKMNTMDQNVKSAFLKNSQSFQLATGMPARPSGPPLAKQSPGSSSFSSSTPDKPPSDLRSSIARDSDYFLVPRPQSVLASNHQVVNHQKSPSSSFIRSSGDKQRAKGKKGGQERNSVILAEGSGGSAQNSPAALARWLRDGPPAAVMDLSKVKKLRMLLRQETTLWVETFLREGGYVFMLQKLTEVLEMEWREEQHDDQLLHELLRCIKALATSDIGCLAIRQHAPAPFIPLTALFFSDKKPGDVPTRQLMAELILLLFDLFPIESKCGVSQEWNTLPEFVRRLLVGPEKENDLVEFVTVAHRPRVYKTYLTEIADVCRDYFWMFCHANGIWRLADLDVSQVERPTAPGGATGGVEYEAGNYLAVHFRLINAQARACYELNNSSESDTSAWRFHAQLFESGFDRIILSTRKASTTYYPHLHLELARYIALAQQAGYDLPYQVKRLIESPPVNFRKINGQDSEGLPSQGLNGGRFGPEGRQNNYVGNGLPSQVHGSGADATAPGGQRSQIDDRFIFQAPAGRHFEDGAGGRKFSPAPQLNRDIIQSDGNSLLV